MTGTGTTYQLRKKIKDDLFSIDNLSQYNLSFWISDYGFRVGIFDTKIDRCLLFEDYEFYRFGKIERITETMEAIIREHEFLQAGYWNKICVVVLNMKFAFVPEAYHHSACNATFLRMNCDIDSEPNQVYTTLHRSQQIIDIFAIHSHLADWFNGIYPDREVVFSHNTSAFIEGLLKAPDKLDARYLHLLINKNILTVSFFRSGNLQFVNSFRFNNVQDFIYYVSFVMDELSLNAEEVNALVWGNTGTENDYVTLLKEYIRHVRPGSRPRGINFGYRFDELEEHQAFELFSSYHFTK